MLHPGLCYLELFASWNLTAIAANVTTLCNDSGATTVLHDVVCKGFALCMKTIRTYLPNIFGTGLPNRGHRSNRSSENIEDVLS